MATVALKRENRRSKAAFFLFACGWAGLAPHVLAPAKMFWPALTLAFFLGGYGLKTVLHDRKKLCDYKNKDLPESINSEDYPTIDILIAARDEELVITRLIERLTCLKYPRGKFSIWIIDDGSKDNTPRLLEGLKNRFSNLNVIRRSRSSGGGKSGALNEALDMVHGEWLLILDADAQLQEDALERLVFFAMEGGWSAVQLRKAVVNAHHNWLTRCQAMEMAMDTVIQQGRLFGRGVVELRGNGQLIKREILQKCGGFNEETVTDDLDLSFRLLIAGGLVGILWDPPVQEEAVETISALWKQRQRWAEGGLQRFFDYWQELTSNKINLTQKYDLACFFLLQYALPVISFIDLLFTSFTHTLPAYLPLSVVAFSVSGFAYWQGCRTNSEGPLLPEPRPWLLLISIAYLIHWFIVIPWVTFKMVIFPKTLVWAKTSHHG